MSGIRSKDTRPELTVRKLLHHRGYRYRLHSRELPGKPDVIFASRKAIIFVHGCFWHGHGCHLFKWPSTRREFWTTKVFRNREKDLETENALMLLGWRTLTIWECTLKGKKRKPIAEVIEFISQWLDSGSASAEITGRS